ncbi:hypothetical protein [Miniphocaeibacter massiliensis]|uniref:hypothetical protein n=1 Tax=Miniphocaeibacter massiliensis TaxID=2041841 RepID=UPI000C080E7C|nr:hypothetical protein [Miniphocaeibacter massiliensis]
MSKAVWIISFKLKEKVSKKEFIEATKKLYDNVLSKAKGFVSWEQYIQDDIWTDFVTWESYEDARNGVKAGTGNEYAKKFYSMIQLKTCNMLTSSFVKKY